MAESHFYMKSGDTAPALRVRLRDSDNDNVDVTGATIKCSIKHRSTGRVLVNEGTVTLVTASAGLVEYEWAAGDLPVDISGDCDVEFEVTYVDTTIETFPNNNGYKLTLHITSQIG